MQFLCFLNCPKFTAINITEVFGAVLNHSELADYT